MLISYSYRKHSSVFDTPRAEIIIGRPKEGIAIDLDLTPDRCVSRPHARIWIEDEQLWIQDMGSTHGTWINGNDIRNKGKQEISNNDIVLVGETILTTIQSEKPASVLPLHPISANTLQASESAKVEFAKRTQLFYGLSLEFGSPFHSKSLLETILRRTVEEIEGAERGALLLGHDLLLFAHYPPDSRPSTTLAYQAIEKQRAFIWPSFEQMDSSYTSDITPPSIRDNQVETAMYAPLLWQGEVLGVLCVDNSRSKYQFQLDDLRVLQTTAQYAAFAVAYNKMQETWRRAEETLRNFQKLVPSEIGIQIRQQRGRMHIGGEFSDVTVLFADIRGFTQMSASMSAGDVADMIEDYFGGLVSKITAHHGMVVKYIGDAIMAIFRGSTENSEDTMAAIEVALEMQGAMRQVNVRRDSVGKRTSDLGIGINWGEVVYGFVGTPERMEFSVIGDTVNFASRYCDGARGGEILISPQAHQRVWRNIRSEQTNIPTKHEGQLTAYRVIGRLNTV